MILQRLTMLMGSDYNGVVGGLCDVGSLEHNVCHVIVD